MEPTAAAAPLIAPSLVQTGSERYDGSPSSLFRYLEIILHSHLSICFLLFACAGASASSSPPPPLPSRSPFLPSRAGWEPRPWLMRSNRGVISFPSGVARVWNAGVSGYGF